MFLAWAHLSGFASEDFTDDFGDDLEQLRLRKLTPGSYVQILDGVFMDNQLNNEGNAFAQEYYDGEESSYKEDYSQSLRQKLPTIYHVSDSWENFEIIKPIIDSHFSEWKAKN